MQQHSVCALRSSLFWSKTRDGQTDRQTDGRRVFLTTIARSRYEYRNSIFLSRFDVLFFLKGKSSRRDAGLLCRRRIKMREEEGEDANDDDFDDASRCRSSSFLDVTSRSKTILAALRRLSSSSSSLKFSPTTNKPLNVLVLGADRNEGRNDEETERIFRECGRERRVNLSLFGPNLIVTTAMEEEKDKKRAAVGIDGRLDDEKKMRESEGGVKVVERERCLFHERKNDDEEEEETNIEYDCAFAFNAGVWGYDSWLESFRKVLKRYPNAPIVVSAYSTKECELDEDCVREGFGEDEIRFVWEAEENEACSGEKTGGEEGGRENSAWMCFVKS